ncbi:MAG TPA: folylpolyglutamate synthase/dihydrofolate synthase family protein [Pyrinomonadaceae bacterium]|nr:folylpolyglutamate synthase/dihydrofolate synthase family protein [Pyrinomonadaceae bacterium]
MNFSEATQYLLSLGHETLAIKLGLRNTKLLLEQLGHPENSYRSVQIAGTNGKGSTAVFLASICRAAGIATGLYTSPHLVSITERIKIDGQDITEVNFAAYATEVRTASEELVALGKLEARPTFFEQVTAIALLAFRERRVEVAILETGLGGRLDATTAVGAGIVAITPISLDHEEYLGHTLNEIAAEKAAIIHPHSEVVVAPQTPETQRVILERCRETGVRPVWVRKDSCESLRDRYICRTANKVYENIQLGLRGAHQLTNAATAITLAEMLALSGAPIDKEAIREGLKSARHPGRLELFEGHPENGEKFSVLLDGAHNAAGARALRTYLDHVKLSTNAPLTLIFGAMADKQLDEMAATLFPVASRLILTQPHNPRSANIAELRQLAGRYAPGVASELTSNSATALERALGDDPGRAEFVCVAGSLYLVGEVRQWLSKRYGASGRFS